MRYDARPCVARLPGVSSSASSSWAAVPARSPDPPATGCNHGGDAGSTKYAPLDRITRGQRRLAPHRLAAPGRQPGCTAAHPKLVVPRQLPGDSAQGRRDAVMPRTPSAWPKASSPRPAAPSGRRRYGPASSRHRAPAGLWATGAVTAGPACSQCAARISTRSTRAAGNRSTSLRHRRTRRSRRRARQRLPRSAGARPPRSSSATSSSSAARAGPTRATQEHIPPGDVRGLRRAHGIVALDLPCRAAAGRARPRDVGARVVEGDRQRQGVEFHQRRRASSA